MDRMTTTTPKERRIPRAVIHKQILDAAEARPDATIDELATAVSGATVDLVERVLDEYGDPGRESPPDSPDNTVTESRPLPQSVREDLTETQRETLRCIYEHPTASQREIASLLDVTHTTVYHRVQSIEGFGWEDRWAIVTALFDSADQDCWTAIEKILDRIEQGTNQARDRTSASCSVFADPKLTQKIIHACIDADAITDDEIHLIVDDFLQRTLPARDDIGQ
jgi:DNA-binding CsgD family transcriptional regulator